MEGTLSDVDSYGFFSPGTGFEASPIGSGGPSAPQAPPLPSPPSSQIDEDLPWGTKILMQNERYGRAPILTPEEQLMAEKMREDQLRYGIPPVFSPPERYEMYGPSERGEIHLKSAMSGYYPPEDDEDLELGRRIGFAGKKHGFLSFDVHEGAFHGALPSPGSFRFGDDPEPKGKEREDRPIPGPSQQIEEVAMAMNTPELHRSAKDEVEEAIKQEEKISRKRGREFQEGENRVGSLKRARNAVNKIFEAPPSVSEKELKELMDDAQRRYSEYLADKYPEKVGGIRGGDVRYLRPISLSSLVLASPMTLTGEKLEGSLPKDQSIREGGVKKRKRPVIFTDVGLEKKRSKGYDAPEGGKTLEVERRETLESIRERRAIAFYNYMQKRMEEEASRLSVPKQRIMPTPSSNAWLRAELEKKGVENISL